MNGITYFFDKKIWVTGASSGIGKEITFQLAKAAKQIIISGRNADVLNDVRIQSGFPEKILVLAMDQSSRDSVKRACDFLLSEGEAPDVVFCNGGVSQRAYALKTEEEVERYVFETNYFSQIYIAKRFIQAKVNARELHLVVTSSLLGKWGFPYRSTYSATKHALHGYFDSLRMETRNSGVKISLVLPGFINTPISVNAVNEDGKINGSMDKNQAGGISAFDCARKIIKGVARGKKEFSVGGKETMGLWLRRFFPALFDRVLIKKNPR
jgi:short-subunit dehydrogenase